jgi:hypothetical protein
MKILLLFPPVGDPTQPYTGLSCLTAFLKQHGYNVIQKDVNIEAFDTLLNKERLQMSYRRILERFRLLEKKEKLVSYEEQKEYIHFSKTILSGSYVVDIEAAKEVLRNPDEFPIFRTLQ